MHNLKRTFSFLLAVVMCFSCLVGTSLTAYAVDKNDGGYIEVNLTDADTGAGISGARFSIKDKNGSTVQTVTTNSEGYAKSGFLVKGDYTVYQTYIGDGYIPDTSYRSVKVTEDPTDPHVLEFESRKSSALVIYAYDEHNAPIADVGFIVYDAKTGLEKASGETDNSGTLVFEQMGPGTYTVVETVAPEGYELVNPHDSRVIVPSDGAGYSRFVHVAQQSIKMRTLDNKGEPITGAVYQVITANKDLVGNFAADGNGEAMTGPLKPGMYYVTQIEAPDGYLHNTTSRTVNIIKGQEPQVELFYCSKISNITIQNYIQGSSLGLAGCEFTVENAEGKVLYTGTTDDTGVLTTPALEPGFYTVKQVSVKDGYLPVERVRTVEVTTGASTSVKFENTTNSSLTIQLTDAKDSNKGLEGAKFLVEQVGGNFKSEYVTGADGTVTTGTLPDGTYLVHQETAPEGYILPITYQWAEVKTGNDTIVHFTNSRISGLVIQALEEGTHRGIPGAVFEVYDRNDKLVDTKTSDSTGIVTFDILSSGEYLIKEITVPGGYTARTETQTATVTTYDPTTVTFYHTIESSLTITLTDALTEQPLSDAQYRVTKDNGDYVGEYYTNAAGQIIIPSLEAGIYIVTEIQSPAGYILDSNPYRVTVKDGTPSILPLENEALTGLRIINTCEQDGRPVAGSTFKVTRYDGTLVGNYTTNSAGLINIPLAPGAYTIYQTYVADGYVLNEQVWNVTIHGNTGEKLEVQNQRESGIVVRMIDAETREGIYGVELEIVDERNNFVGRYFSDNTGRVFLTDVLGEGRYQVRLLNVPTGYTMDNVPKTIIVNLGETTELTWSLTGIKGQLTIVTYSGEDNVMMNVRANSKLSDAIYTITDTSGRVVQTIRGDINGEAHSGSLDLGTYYVQQVMAPSGWQVNAAKFAIHVTSVNDNIRVEVFNKAANYKANVEAHGQTTAVAGGMLKYWFSNIRNDSTSPMNNFYVNIKVPTDTVRATTFYTGTYNTPTTYRIEYKTNINDYRILASGLNSQSQYSYDMSTVGLALGANEYVTDIRLVFPTVVSGFHENMAPTLNCYVLSTVRNGHQAILRVEVGGQVGGYYVNNSNGGIWGSNTGETLYPSGGATINGGSGNAGTWTGGSSQFTTVIYGYAQNQLPSNLPKTGY